MNKEELIEALVRFTEQTDVSGINAVTNATPSFDSEEELDAYLVDVHNTIGEFIKETRE